MPAVVAIAIRALIQMAVTLGLIELADRFVFPMINDGIAAIMSAFGVPEATAKDIMANEILKFAEELGIGVVALRTKLPTRIAEFLGFTAKGWSKRTLGTTVATKTAGTSIAAASSAVATKAEATTIAAAVAKTKSLALPGVETLLKLMTVFVAIPTGFFFMVAQFIDFANWSGPYQGTFQKLLSYVGLNVDAPAPKARTISSDVWNRIAATIEELGPTTLYFPSSGQVRPYSRTNLADLVDEIAAGIAASGGNASYKNVFGTVLPLVHLGGKTSGVAASSSGSSAVAASTAAPSVKVFTGIVSSGVLGKGLTFTPRQDDLIDNIGELNAALNNNLAPWLAAIATRLIYEVKVVSTITTKEGVKQYGQAQQIQSRDAKSGALKTKTVVNKWAVCDIYVLTDRQVRTKITQIVLGPTNAAKFQPGATELAGLSAVVADQVVLKDTDGIDTIATDTPTEVIPKEDQEEVVPTQPTKIDTNLNDPNGNYIYEFGNQKIRFKAKTEKAALDLAKLAAPNYGYQWNPKTNSFVPLGSSSSSSGGGGGQGSGSGLPAAALNAGSLSDFYKAQGLALPSLSERAMIYQGFGLGSSSLYAGTAEQNTKLLKKLQGKPL